MVGLALLVLGGCAQEPRTDHGTLLLATGTSWVVQHDDPLSRTVQSVEVYSNTDTSVPAGAHVDLWTTRDANDHGTVERSRVTGTDPLPSTHIAGGAPVSGTIVRAEPRKLLIDHEPIPGVMPAMVMPFVAGPIDTTGRLPGDRITGTIVGSRYGYAIADVHVTGSVPVSGAPQAEPLAIGESLDAYVLDGHDGAPVSLGVGQGHPTVLAYVYTTCPDPTYCPATVARLQAIDQGVPDDVRIVAVTIDPDVDTVPTLASYAEQVGAVAPRWVFARPSPAELHTLAVAAGLTVSHRSGRIAHSTRVLVLDANGRVTQRFEDNTFTVEDVSQALQR